MPPHRPLPAPGLVSHFLPRLRLCCCLHRLPPLSSSASPLLLLPSPLLTLHLPSAILRFWSSRASYPASRLSPPTPSTLPLLYFYLT
ncbi:hypothetical protein BOTBODRAFT_37750 [Botryobasidium botryosum FD-172 SS1]|uniref:Uncharacterized protein n=1 Tax=Botryobasidium botryosum (strain FD-172 SS1) TaxID=930990 RepID=A0A067MAF9_BOTB1|nr:hypothetical protein BOTBODRAFT_37750 [Botryobasidium botryosum FD-172 SS1]